MSVSIAEIVAAARAGQASLVSESAGYVVLGLADASAKVARIASPAEVGIDEQGDVVCSATLAADPSAAERRIRRLLGYLLAETRTPSPNLLRVAERQDLVGLSHLVVELEAALVPVNRKAARRSLARLCRETARALERGVSPATDFQAEPVAAPAVVTAPALAAPVVSAPVMASTAAEAPAPELTASQGRRESVPPAPMKMPAGELPGDGPRIVADGRFDALRKLHSLRTDAAILAKPAAEDAELDVDVEVELEPLELSVVAPRVADVSRTPALPSAWPGGSFLAAERPFISHATDVTDADVSEELVDTTPTTVLARVVAEAPAGPSLNLFAPTPVSSVVDAPVELISATPSDARSPLPSEAQQTAPSEAESPSAPPAAPRRSPSESPHRPSDVNDLLARFGSVTRTNDGELLRGLERLSGVERGRVQSPVVDPEERVRPAPVVAIR
jgi:hypothetical protein